ncbi:hypothetical protein ACHAXT_009582 [Thalassiosira profunda]
MASYRPTPLERAYASHLLSTHFATPFDPNSPASEDDAETIRVPGRNAVPFLTTSGVERSLLRLLWQAADPDGVGTLTKRSQVYTLLRFVAMAQAHFLPPLRGEMGDEDKLQLLRETLQSNSHLVVALPTFGADQPPSVAHLMGTYPPPKEASSFSAAADHDFQYQMFMKQQSDSTAANTMAGAATGEDRTMSVSDAFGSMGEVEDRPLAPLQATPVLEEPESIEKEGAPEMPVLEDGGEAFAGEEGEEFGTFDSVPAQPMDDPSAPPADDNFGAFDSVPSEGMGNTQLEAQATGNAEAEPAGAVTQPAMEDEEDFGGFNGPVTDLPSTDEFGGFSDAPGVQNAEDEDPPAGENVEEMKEDGDTFSDFDQAPTDSTAASLPALGTGAPTLSISDAFGSLVEQDQGMGMAVASDVPPPEVNAVEEEGAGDDDDFGDFSGIGGAAVDDADDAEPIPAPVAGEEEIKPESAEPSAAGDHKLSVFDSLVEVEDAPLPALGAFSAGEVDAKDDTAEDDDGFGDFADHGEEAGEKEGPDSQEEEDFGDFEKIDKSEVPSPEEAAAIAGGEPEDGMTPPPAAASLLPSTEGEETPAAAGLSHVDSGSEKLSAFDALTEVQDAPLSPLGSFAAGNDVAEPVAVDQEANEDSFGDFADPVPTEESTGEGKPDVEDTADNEAEGADFGSGQSPADDVGTANIEGVASEQQAGSTASAFDAFSDVEDAPLPPLGSFAVGNGVAEPVAVDGEAAEDSFGDFASPEEVSDTLMDNPDAGMEDAPEICGEEAGVQIAEDNFASAFDVFGETQDAPLPSLDAFAPAADAVTSDETKANEEDEFGGFEGTVQNENAHATAAFSTADVTVSVGDADPDASFDAFASSNAPSDANDNKVFVSEQETASNQPAMLDAFEKVPPPPLVVGKEGESAEPKADEHEFGISEGDTVVQHNTGGFEAFPAAHNDGGLGAGMDDFGDFTAPQSYVQGASPPGNNEAQADDDEFGDFAGQEFTEPPSDNNLSVEPKANEQAFGDVEGDTVIAHNLTEGFEAFPAAASGFGAEGEVFGGLSYVQGEAAGDSANAAAIESNPGDVGEGFGDFSSFDKTTPQPESDKDVRLAELLRSQLGDEFVGRLPADWKDVILSAIEKDLQRANKVMDDLSNTLSPKDRALIVKSKKLREHVLGLAEFVRIVRSIAATIGDLLGVSKDVDVQEATLSQWQDNEIIADAIVIEYLWSEISSKAVGLGILSKAPPLETVVEIRAGAPPINARRKGEICQLTLQPLGAGGPSTQSPVEWKGKQYTACAANFCLNRVPEYAM